MNRAYKYRIKRNLFNGLKAAHAFWSYDAESITLSGIDDDMLIQKVLYHLDIDQSRQLFQIYSKQRIKEVWKNRMCPLGDYCKMLNRMYAYIYFDIKNPDRYLKIQSNRFIKRKISHLHEHQ